MKITQSQLRQIIKEELEATLSQEGFRDTLGKAASAVGGKIARGLDRFDSGVMGLDPRRPAKFTLTLLSAVRRQAQVLLKQIDETDGSADAISLVGRRNVQSIKKTMNFVHQLEKSVERLSGMGNTEAGPAEDIARRAANLMGSLIDPDATGDPDFLPKVVGGLRELVTDTEELARGFSGKVKDPLAGTYMPKADEVPY
tara:strand:+ start:101 stop:697 length:597 start_codon:yes stop_codon:yes gene_type:complete